MFDGSSPIFLGTLGDGRLKSQLFSAIIGRQFGHHPRATNYRPIAIVIETPRKFSCMLPDSRSITHASFMGIKQFFWAQWVVEG